MLLPRRKAKERGDYNSVTLTPPPPPSIHCVSCTRRDLYNSFPVRVSIDLWPPSCLVKDLAEKKNTQNSTLNPNPFDLEFSLCPCLSLSCPISRKEAGWLAFSLSREKGGFFYRRSRKRRGRESVVCSLSPLRIWTSTKRQKGRREGDSNSNFHLVHVVGTSSGTGF